jgi:hypothetical protein
MNHVGRHCEQGEAIQTWDCGCGVVWIASLSLAMTVGFAST